MARMDRPDVTARAKLEDQEYYLSRDMVSGMCYIPNRALARAELSRLQNLIDGRSPTLEAVTDGR